MFSSGYSLRTLATASAILVSAIDILPEVAVKVKHGARLEHQGTSKITSKPARGRLLATRQTGARRFCCN